jgi:pilus assembly protein CpaE
LGGITAAAALVVHLDPTDEAAFAAVAACARHPDAPPLIAAVQGLTVDATRRLMRAGVHDVLPAPFTETELAAVLEPLRAAPRRAGADQHGEAVSFFGTGGSGSTALAVQAAIELAGRGNVCLIDLDVQRGTAALQLDLKPQLTLMDLLAAGNRLDASLFQSVAVTHASGLSVVASPPEILPLDELTVEAVDALVALARRQFALVVLDLPAEWTDWKLRALERSAIGMLVTATTVAGVQRTGRLLPLLEANHLAERVQLIANRVARPLFGETSLVEQEAVLRRAYAYRVTADEAMDRAIEQGKTLADVRAGRLLKEVKALAAGIEGQIQTMKALSA